MFILNQKLGTPFTASEYDKDTFFETSNFCFAFSEVMVAIYMGIKKVTNDFLKGRITCNQGHYFFLCYFINIYIY